MWFSKQTIKRIFLHEKAQLRAASMADAINIQGIRTSKFVISVIFVLINFNLFKLFLSEIISNHE